VPPEPAAPAPGATAIDFHFNVDHGVAYACRVVRKARAAGRTVLVYSRDTARLARVDQALWTFSALDFLPHVPWPSPLAARTPVWLSDAMPDAPRDLLLALDDEVLPDFARWLPAFGRVIDVVSTDPEDRARARVRFKAYRDAGFTPTTHEIASA
jgi:DNA polymerase III subunit chi